MPDENQPQPDQQPAQAESPAPEPPPSAAEETTVLPQEPAPANKEPGRFQRAAKHRATPIVAAALAGVLVGGGVMSLIAFTGDDDERDRDRIGLYRDDDGPERFKRHDGPERFERPDGPRWYRGHPEGVPRVPELRERPIPDHRHDEDGNVIPAPESDRDSEDGGN